MTAENFKEVHQASTFTIPYEEIKQYVQVDTPIIPLKENGHPDDSNIFTNEELNTIPRHLPQFCQKDIYDKNGKIRKLKLLSLQPLPPSQFWTDERINRQVWAGIACQTGYIASLHCFVIGVDTDSDKTRAIAEKLIKQFNLDKKTIIQISAHGGRHIIFKVRADSANWATKYVTQERCKTGCEIEIKTQTMMITLAPSRHRKDGKAYIQTGIRALDELEWLYDMFINELKLADCFLFGDPDEYYRKKNEEAKFTIDADAERFPIAEPQIVKGIDIILGQDEENIKDGSPFKSTYIKKHRHNVVVSAAGHFIHNYTTLESAEEFIRRLGEAAGDSVEDINNSLRKVREKYQRALGDNPKPVRGRAGLIEAFIRAHKNNSKSEAEQRLKHLSKALGLERNHPKGNGSRENEARHPGKNYGGKNWRQLLCQPLEPCMRFGSCEKPL